MILQVEDLEDLEIELNDPFGVIYGLRSPSGKWYIGQTTWNINDYIRIAYQNNLGKGRPKLYDAINEFGFESFNIYIISEAENQSILNEMERKIIIFFNSINNGYNLREGGSNGKMHESTKILLREAAKLRGSPSIETRKKISLSLIGNSYRLGHKVSEDLRKYISSYMKGRQHLLGYKHTEESKSMIRKSMIKACMDNIYPYLWKIKDPNGIVYENINNLKKFARLYSIHTNVIIRGSHGWKLLSKINIETGEELISGITS